MEAITSVYTPRFSPILAARVFHHRNPFFTTNNALFSGLSLISSTNFKSLQPPIRAIERSNQGNSDGSDHNKVLDFANAWRLTKAVLNFAVPNFLPIALLTGVALGIANPAPGCLAHKYSLSKFSHLEFSLSQGREIEAVAKAWPVGAFGLIVGTGLAIFSFMPTTLSSGVALTQLVGGNTALAFAMTVISNLLGILTVPFWISNFLADGFGVSIPAPWMQVSKSRPLLLMVKPRVFIEAIEMHGNKALLIVVAVVEQLSDALGESRLLILPCVAAHINQIIVDSLVNFWLQKDQSYNKIKYF